MNLYANNQTGSLRNGHLSRWKTKGAALLAAMVIVPFVYTQAEEQKPNKVWSVSGEKSTPLYSLNFEGGSLVTLKGIWTNAFPNDNFLTTAGAERVELSAFQIHDMSLTELARSIAFLSQGLLSVEVVDRTNGVPGNIWRVSGTSQEALSRSFKMRAVPAPHLLADEKTLARFLEQAEGVQRQLLYTFSDLQKSGSPVQWMVTQILPLKEQRVLVLVGTEEGVSGFESLIKAAEQTNIRPI